MGKPKTVKSVRNGIVNPDIGMDGKTVLITGANAGLGLASAVDLAKRGARVIMACRDLDRGTAALEEVIEETGSQKVVLKELDLSSMQSVRKFAEDINRTESRLDVLMNNAGVMMCPQSKTAEGYETQFGVNHLGHFLLTNLLLDLLKRSAPSRIVTVSSIAHYYAKIKWEDLNFDKNYNSVEAYGQSKLMNVLFSRELSKRLQGTGVMSTSLEPGVVKTNLQRHLGTITNPTCWDRFMSCFTCCCICCFANPMEGAQTQIYCAVAPELSDVTGKFYGKCKLKAESDDAKNDEYAKRLWEISEDYTGLNESSKATEVQRLNEE